MPHPALCPQGFTPLLSHQAAQDRRLVAALLDRWETEGFTQVAPISVDFSDRVFEEKNEGIRARAFRFMDPSDGAMLALLPDVTLGIARLAKGQLGDFPRPLRLSYEGQAIRASGSATRPARQFGQVGIEMIGVEGHIGQIGFDLISLSIKSLYDLGLQQISVTLVDPPFTGQFIDEHLANLSLTQTEKQELMQALDRKDEGKIHMLAGKKGPQLIALMSDRESSDPLLTRLFDLKSQLSSVFAGQDLDIGVEPFEQKGFPFQSGPSFALYTKGLRGELGRGGFYKLGDEACFGFTFYRDALLTALA